MKTIKIVSPYIFVSFFNAIAMEYPTSKAENRELFEALQRDQKAIDSYYENIKKLKAEIVYFNNLLKDSQKSYEMLSGKSAEDYPTEYQRWLTTERNRIALLENKIIHYLNQIKAIELGIEDMKQEAEDFNTSIEYLSQE